MTPEEALAAVTARDNERAAANATILSLRQDNALLRQRMEWFERQFFGTRSGKRMFDSPEQGPDMF